MTERSMPIPEERPACGGTPDWPDCCCSGTAAAAVAEAGGVEIDGAVVGKSDRLEAGAWLSVTLLEERPPVENTPVEIEGMTILYSDDDIVAVDKPPGVAAHATVGWHGPTVLGGLAAAGFRSAPPAFTSARASCNGWTRAPPVSWWWRFRTRLHRAQACIQAAHRRQALSRCGARTSGSVEWNHRRPDRSPPQQ